MHNYKKGTVVPARSVEEFSASTLVQEVSKITEDKEKFSNEEHNLESLQQDTQKEALPEFSSTKKVLIIFIIAFAGLLGPISTNIFVPALSSMQEDLMVQDVTINLTITVYMVFLAITPLIWGTLSDQIGRRLIYLVSLTIYIIGGIGCALSINIVMLIVMRAIQAIGASAVLSVGAGTISDVFPPAERGTAFGFYFIGPLLGPIIGPVIGGFMSATIGWRHIFYLIAGLGGASLLSIIFFLPETMSKVRLKRQAKTQNPTVSSQTSHINFLQPLLLLRYPSVMIVLAYGCMIFASIYCYTTSLPSLFSPKYHLNQSAVGLVFLSSGIGNIVGSSIGGRVADFSLRSLRAKYGTLPVPSEARFRAVWLGTVLLPAMLLCYGWFVQYELPLPATLVSMFFLGFSMTYIFSSISTYLVDIFPGLGASVTALNNCMRYLAAAVASAIVSPLMKVMGPGWLFTGLAILTSIFGVLLFVVYKYGHKWRPQ
ncbi:Dityrosine transporter 1 [Basidiobolus ranarum]|uniref:Dityrosine transporter 1 n=1 Tax=Basidiobolus ranarum TaxID=34480 RepID=A0ABR2VPM9_9FUNG